MESNFPKDLKECGKSMSNFDNSIDAGLEEALRNGFYGTHPARDHWGKVWFDGIQFCEEVWRYNSPIEVIQAGTLRQLMDVVNEKYGSR